MSEWWLHKDLPKAKNDDDQTLEIVDGDLHVDGQGHDVTVPRTILEVLFQRVPDTRRIDPQRG